MNLDRKILALVVRFLSVIYILFSIFTLGNCTDKSKSDSALERIKAREADSIRILTDRFDAEQFMCDNPIDTVNKCVILDTTIIDVQNRNGLYFIRAEIKTGCRQQYFAELKCSNKIVESFNKTKSNDALVVARVISITATDYLAEADSLGGSNPILNTGIVFLLQGECLALLDNTLTANED